MLKAYLVNRMGELGFLINQDNAEFFVCNPNSNFPKVDVAGFFFSLYKNQTNLLVKNLNYEFFYYKNVKVTIDLNPDTLEDILGFANKDNLFQNLVTMVGSDVIPVEFSSIVNNLLSSIRSYMVSLLDTQNVTDVLFRNFLKAFRTGDDIYVK